MNLPLKIKVWLLWIMTDDHSLQVRAWKTLEIPEEIVGI